MKRSRSGELLAEPLQSQQSDSPGDHQNLGSAVHERIVQAVLSAFAALPKTGKPQPNEYTVLAGFAVTIQELDRARPAEPIVVSLGTGTKCLGASKRSCNGDLLNDSHAEVIARRALLRWLYNELRSALAAHEGDAVGHGPAVPGSLFRYSRQQGRFEQVAGWQLHMFASRMPCGDACISAASEGGMPEPGARTGAKLLAQGRPLPQAADVEEQQAAGAPRRKPGRGDATLSMSCSDKLAKWALLGVQGALLSALLTAPLHLASLVVGGTVSQPAAHAALHRALIGRTAEVAGRLAVARPGLDLAVIGLPRLADSCGLAPSAARTVPSGVAINWSAGASSARPRKHWDHLPVVPMTKAFAAEVTLAASGRIAGVAKKGPGWDSPKTRSSLCKAAMWEHFCGLRLSMVEAFQPAGSAEIDAQSACLELMEAGRQGFSTAAAGSERQDQPEGKAVHTYGQTKAETAYRRDWLTICRPPSLFEAWIQKDVRCEEFA